MLRAYSKSERTGKRRAPARPAGDPTAIARDYALHLLASLGIDAPPPLTAPDPHPALAWAASGAMAVTGPENGAPALAPGHVAACARGALHALTAIADDSARRALATLDGASLLAERAALLGLRRGGTTSAG